MMRQLKPCLYKNRKCFVRKEFDDGTVIIVTSDNLFAQADGGWERVDKFESEKRLKVDEITIFDNGHD